MSFGFGVGDFIAVLTLANKVRKQFVDATRQLQDISEDDCRMCLLRDIDDNDPANNLAPGQKETLKDISLQCRKVLDDLDNKVGKHESLQKDKSGFRSTARGFWSRIAFDKAEIDDFRRRIDTNTNAFNLFLTNATHQLAREIKHGVDQLVQHQDNQRRQDILNWLSPITHDVKQADFFGRVQPGTGSWLLDSDEFKQWTSQGEATPEDERTLFCPGLPGAGKAFLTSIVINELRQSIHEDDQAAIAFFYCNFREQTTRAEILMVLLRQFVQQLSVIPNVLEEAYAKHLEHRSPLTVDESLGVLSSTLAAFSRTFVLLDALDECHLQGAERGELLADLFKLQETQNLGLFATSRDNPDISRSFYGKLNLRIRATAADVARFLRGQLEDLPKVVLQNEDLQRDIVAAVTDSIDGMFLLAQLRIDSIRGKRSAKMVRESLKNLPSGLDAAYDDGWVRIESQLPDEVQTAKDVLSWVSCATRPLSTRELQHALAIEDNLSFLDEDNIPDIEDVLAVCVGLVTVDEQEHVVRLVHYTAQEYFEQHQAKIFPNGQSDIGSKCIQYLCFDAFKTGALWDSTKYISRLEEYALFEYSAQNLLYHALREEVKMDLIFKLLTNPLLVGACYQVILYCDGSPRSRSTRSFSYRTYWNTWVPRIHKVVINDLVRTGIRLIIMYKNGNLDPEMVKRYISTYFTILDNNGIERRAQLIQALKTELFDRMSDPDFQQIISH